MRVRRAWLLVLFLCACGEKEAEHAAPAKPATKTEPAHAIVRNPKGQPRWVEFDHIFITYKEQERFGQPRSKEEAKVLAHTIYEWARDGTDWDLLKDKYSDDRSKETGRANGPYVLVNDGLHYRAGQIPRGQYAKRVGDLLFTMKKGEIRLAEYDPKDCKFGWHVLKRLQ